MELDRQGERQSEKVWVKDMRWETGSERGRLRGVEVKVVGVCGLGGGGSGGEGRWGWGENADP